MNEQQEKLLNALTEADEWYQQLLRECETAEVSYQKVLSRLSAADRETVEHYIALCEEMEYRRTCLAATKMQSRLTQ